MHSLPAPESARLPRAPIDRLVGPFARFFRVQAAGGCVLLICALTAIAAANSGQAEAYHAFWARPLGIRIGSWTIEHSLLHWINDGLMVFFFFVVGLEIKREVVRGELRQWRTALVPVAAAAGGMVAPASIYLALQWGRAGERGWGIPMATDIAFVVGALALMGRRVPHGLRIFLLSLAIVDDLGAILVIALGYTTHLDPGYLMWGAGGIALIVTLSRLGVRSIPIYVVAGAAVWFCFHESGVHATIAGVVLALLTPLRAWISADRLGSIIQGTHHVLSEAGSGAPPLRSALRNVEIAARETLSPLERLEISLHPWVSFAIMPVFALANAGVEMQWIGQSNGVAVAVIAGLTLGKPLGILSFTWLMVRLRFGQLPSGVSWRMTIAAAVLAGIGFTMSLFIAGLALEAELLASAKFGILAGSVASGIAGMALLLMSVPRAALRGDSAPP